MKWGELRTAILEELESGDWAALEVAESLGVAPNSIRGCMTRMSKTSKKQLIHVARYVSELPGARPQLRAVYAKGAGVNAKKPKKQTAAACCARYQRKKKAQRANSVFALALTIVPNRLPPEAYDGVFVRSVKG